MEIEGGSPVSTKQLQFGFLASSRMRKDFMILSIIIDHEHSYKAPQIITPLRLTDPEPEVPILAVKHILNF